MLCNFVMISCPVGLIVDMSSTPPSLHHHCRRFGKKLLFPIHGVSFVVFCCTTREIMTIMKVKESIKSKILRFYRSSSLVTNLRFIVAAVVVSWIAWLKTKRKKFQLIQTIRRATFDLTWLRLSRVDGLGEVEVVRVESRMWSPFDSIWLRFYHHQNVISRLFGQKEREIPIHLLNHKFETETAYLTIKIIFTNDSNFFHSSTRCELLKMDRRSTKSTSEVAHASK